MAYQIGKSHRLYNLNTCLKAEIFKGSDDYKLIEMKGTNISPNDLQKAISAAFPEYKILAIWEDSL